MKVHWINFYNITRKQLRKQFGNQLFYQLFYTF